MWKSQHVNNLPLLKHNYKVSLLQVFLFVALFVYLAKDPETEDDDLAVDENQTKEDSITRRNSELSSMPDIQPKEPGYIRPSSPAMQAMIQPKHSIMGAFYLNLSTPDKYFVTYLINTNEIIISVC